MSSPATETWAMICVPGLPPRTTLRSPSVTCDEMNQIILRRSDTINPSSSGRAIEIAWPGSGCRPTRHDSRETLQTGQKKDSLALRILLRHERVLNRLANGSEKFREPIPVLGVRVARLDGKPGSYFFLRFVWRVFSTGARISAG